MADDVAQKAVQSATIKQGIAVVRVQKNGERETEETYVDSKPTIEDMATDNTTRFDDPTYYNS